jgi:hypothetical protein
MYFFLYHKTTLKWMSKMTGINRKSWGDEENKQLIQYWPTIGSVVLISLMMNRTPSSVQTQASRLGLPIREEQRSKHRRRWTENEDITLSNGVKKILTSKNYNIKELSDLMQRSVDAVVSRIIEVHGRNSTIIKMLSTPLVPEKEELTLAMEKMSKQSSKKSGDITKQGKMRQCRMCLRSFWSEWNGNRICLTCKRNEDWD